MTRASVVLATHDRAERLRALLSSLREQTIGPAAFEVVVVDDASSDATPAVLEEELTRGVLQLRVLRHDRARGPAVARDAGWRAATAPFVAFTDDDCRLAPGWLEAGLAAWDGDDARFVQGRTDAEPAELDREGPFTRTLRVHTLGPFFQTANVFYPRPLLERVGGFDTAAFSVDGEGALPGSSTGLRAGWCGEDADLAWRCIAVGAEPVWEPAAQAWHAVHQLGPVGKLKVAWRWSETVRLYARYPQLRATLTYRLFWKKSHYLLVRAALGLIVPWRPLRFWCYAPLAVSYLERARVEGGQPLAAPYFLVYDLVELAAVMRGAVRYRTPVI